LTLQSRFFAFTETGNLYINSCVKLMTHSIGDVVQRKANCFSCTGNGTLKS